MLPRFQSAFALRPLPLLLVLAHFALVPQAAAQDNPRFTHIAAGGYHSLALKADGTVVAWGGNSFGQCTPPPGLANVVAVAAAGSHSLALKSDGTVVAWGEIFGGNGYVPETPPPGLANVVAIAAGGEHSLALKSDGTVVAWGYNANGQTAVPDELTGVVAIAAGDVHSLALKSDGAVVAWGGNFFGSTAVPVGLSGVIAIAVGEAHNLALKSDGSVVAWGNNWAGESTVPAGLTGVVTVAAAGHHSLALKSDGAVVAWGKIWNGTAWVTAAVPGGLTGVVAVAAGGGHSLALNSDGAVVGWGNGHQGQLPQPMIVTQPISQTLQPGTTADFSVAVTGIAPRGYQWLKNETGIIGATNSAYQIPTVQANDAGNYAVIITNTSGSITSSSALLAVLTIPIITQQPHQPPLWAGATANFSVRVAGGLPLNYQWLKDGTNINGATASVYTISNVQTNDAGSYSVIITNLYGSVISSDALITLLPEQPVPNHTPGTVVSWGLAGQSTVPDGLTDVVAIAAGGFLYPGTLGDQGFHSLALKSDGTVVAWGQIHTEIGDYPIEPVPEGLNGVVAISASDFDSLALRSDGTVVAWGENLVRYGETNTVPKGLSNVVAIAGGGGNNLALKSDGTVVAWGYSDQVQSTVPAGLTDVVAIAAAGGNNLALKSDGTVVAWGGNTVPEGLSNVVAIAAGDIHSLALKSDGTVVAWGDNRAGECTVPAGLTGVIAIAAAGIYDDWQGRSLGRSLALKSDGTVVAWGNNEDDAFTVPAGLKGVVAISAGAYQSLALVATAPTIALQTSGHNILLSWPLWAQGFALQATPNLADENSWTPVLTVPVVEGSQNRVTEPMAGPAKFYRLRK